MTDEPDLPDDPEALARVAIEALKAKNAHDVACPICKASGSWTIQERPMLLPHLTAGGEISGDFEAGELEGTQVAAVWCTNCGWLRLHHLQALMAD